MKRMHFQRSALLLIGFFLLQTTAVRAQGLSLETCLSSAENQMPLLKQKPEMAEVLRNKLMNYSRTYLPVFVANGQLSYQSNVPSLGISLPGIPSLSIPKDQYRFWMDFSQPVYDAGFSSAQKKTESANYEVSLQLLEISLNEYKKQVAQVFFQALLASRQSQLIEKTIGLLKEKKAIAESGMKNGILMENDLLKLQSEILAQEKKRLEARSMESGALEILSLLTGIETKGVSLELPRMQWAESEQDAGYASSPELRLIGLQMAALRSAQDIQRSARIPRVSVFGQAGFGSPNPYNFFKSQTSGFFMAGLRASWTIWDWGKFDRDKKLTSLNTSMLSEQKEQKELEIRARVLKLENEAKMLKESEARDREILELRKRIRSNASLQYDQGVITSAQYLDEVLAEQLSEISLAIDETAWLRDQYLIQLETGSLKP